jgi:hypothetical protein
MANIITIENLNFLFSDINSSLNYCEISPKFGTKIKIKYSYENNENLDYLNLAIIEELTERVQIREIENK